MINFTGVSLWRHRARQRREELRSEGTENNGLMDLNFYGLFFPEVSERIGNLPKVRQQARMGPSAPIPGDQGSACTGPVLKTPGMAHPPGAAVYTHISQGKAAPGRQQQAMPGRVTACRLEGNKCLLPWLFVTFCLSPGLVSLS